MIWCVWMDDASLNRIKKARNLFPFIHSLTRPPFSFEKSSFWRISHEKFIHFMCLMAIHSSLHKHVGSIIVIDWCWCCASISCEEKKRENFWWIRKNKRIKKYEFHSYFHVLHHPSLHILCSCWCDANVGKSYSAIFFRSLTLTQCMHASSTHYHKRYSCKFITI